MALAQSLAGAAGEFDFAASAARAEHQRDAVGQLHLRRPPARSSAELGGAVRVGLGRLDPVGLAVDTPGSGSASGAGASASGSAPGRRGPACSSSSSSASSKPSASPPPCSAEARSASSIPSMPLRPPILAASAAAASSSASTGSARPAEFPLGSRSCSGIARCG